MTMTRCLGLIVKGQKPIGHHAVSLIEVLVVISIFVLLLAMLIPSLYRAREQARRLICQNNLNQWGQALHFYRHDYDDYIPTEGNYTNLEKHGTWFNVLPSYLSSPAYQDVERIGKKIKEFPELHVWICPSKYLTEARTSRTGYNQFHYGMNQVLDGLGKPPDGSDDTPGFPDSGDQPLRACRFAKKPHTVFMFDICPNSPAGTQRQVATVHQRGFDGEFLGRFHGDYANILYLGGHVIGCTTDDLVADRDFRHGDLVWTHPQLYWGWTPPPK